MPTAGAKMARPQSPRPCHHRFMRRASPPRRRKPVSYQLNPLSARPQKLNRRCGVPERQPGPERNPSKPTPRGKEHRHQRPRLRKKHDEDNERIGRIANRTAGTRIRHGTLNPKHGTRNTSRTRPPAFRPFTEPGTPHSERPLSLNWQFLSRKRTIFPSRHPSESLAWHVLSQAPR